MKPATLLATASRRLIALLAVLVVVLPSVGWGSWPQPERAASVSGSPEPLVLLLFGAALLAAAWVARPLGRR